MFGLTLYDWYFGCIANFLGLWWKLSKSLFLKNFSLLKFSLCFSMQSSYPILWLPKFKFWCKILVAGLSKLFLGLSLKLWKLFLDWAGFIWEILSLNFAIDFSKFWYDPTLVFLSFSLKKKRFDYHFCSPWHPHNPYFSYFY